MTSRIKYNTPLKSVRTVRALKIEQCEPPSMSVDETGRFSGADLTNSAGVAFVWEDAPGRSKIQLDIASSSSEDLKPPPQQLARPPPSCQIPYVDEDDPLDASASSPPVEANALESACLFVDKEPQSSETSSDALPTRSQFAANHQLPPKPSQRKLASPVTLHQLTSGDKPPPSPRRTISGTLLESGHLKKSYGRNEGHDYRPVRRTRSQEFPFQNEGHRSVLASTLQALISKTGGAVHRGDLNGGNRDLFAERSSQVRAPFLKDFYLSGRDKTVGTVPNSTTDSIQGNDCIPGRPQFPLSECSSHSDDGDQTDIGDAFSSLNMISRDPDGRCQVSVIDGEPLDASRHTDPRARDFIMERFLPAAKAMVTDTPDALDRMSSKETPPGSPSRVNGRSFMPGRSRFAFKDQFVEEDEEEEDFDESDMLFKCKFPWQMGAMTTVGAQSSTRPDPRTVQKSVTLSSGQREEYSPGSHSDDQEDDGQLFAESSATCTPKGSSSSGSFEARRFPSKSMDKNGQSTSQCRSSRALEQDVFNGELSTGDNYEIEYPRKGNDIRSGGFLGFPKDVLNETATHRDSDSRNQDEIENGFGPPVEPSDMTSLAMLLRTSPQQRQDLGKISKVVNEGATGREQIAPSSIMNHHRCQESFPLPAADSSAHSRSNAAPMARYLRDRDDSSLLAGSNCSPKQLKPNLVRQKISEPSGGSGRSLESINDEVWVASGRNSSSGSKSPTLESCDRPSMTFTNIFDSTNIDIGTCSWPLGKSYTAYTRTPNSDSKDASFSSFSDQSVRSPSNSGLSIQQEKSLSDKHSPVSVLQPPLPKSPAESWLFKVRQPASHLQGGAYPKKILDYNGAANSKDVKWEALVKSENAQHNNRIAQTFKSSPS